MRLLRLISLPYVRKHLLRYALLVAGVAVGVGFAVALEGGTRSILAEFRQTVEQIAGSCQLQVSAGEAGVPEALIERLQQLPEVRAASPVIEALAETGADATRLLVIGVDMTGDAQMRPWLFQTGDRSTEIDPITFLAQPDSILMNRGFAARRGWKIGSQLQLRTMAGLKIFTIRGLLAGDSLERIYGGNVAIMDVFGAQHVFGRDSSVDRIEIVLSEDVSLDRGREAIERVIGPGYSVEPPAARGEQFEDLLSAYQSLQFMACLFATALGICMIDASFRLAVAQRRTEIGILRSLGATRRQIQSLFLLEGLLTGIAGSALGLALGIRVFVLVANSMNSMFRGSYGGLAEQQHQFQVSPSIIALAFLTGIGISLLASWLPSREASHANPMEVFRPMHFQQGMKTWQPRAILLSALLGVGAIAGAVQEKSAFAFYGSMILLLLAIALAIPTLVLILVRPLRPLFARAFGVEGALALDSILRTPRRTVTTIAVLTLVCAQAVIVAGIQRSVLQTVGAWVQGAFQSDLLLSASANLASQSLRFPQGFEATLRNVAGVAAVQPLRTVRLPYRGKPVLVIAADHALSAARKGQRVSSGDWRDMCAKAGAGKGVFVSETLALRERLSLGSDFELNAPAGVLHLPVVGVVSDRGDRRGVVFLSLELYRRYWNDSTADKFRIDVLPGNSAEDIRTRVRESLGDRYPASIMTRSEALDYVTHPKGQRLTPFQIQLLICLLVAALALVNMASISVAERSREFAIMLSVGANRRQVRKTLLLEMLATGGVSLILGLLTGAMLQVYLLLAVQRYVTGVQLDYRFPWDASLWLVCLAAAASVAAVLAAMPAMERIPLSVALDSE